MSIYANTSPYASSITFGSFLDVMTNRSIPKKADDVVYVIDLVYNFRPDLLAADLYNDSKLWWVFAQRNPNVLQDPIFDFKTGVTIYIPNKDTINTALGL